MASFCQRCGKGKMRGHKVSHAKNRSNRIWKVNLQPVNMVVDGIRQKLMLCTSCVREVRQGQREKAKEAALDKKVTEAIRTVTEV